MRRQRKFPAWAQFLLQIQSPWGAMRAEALRPAAPLVSGSWRPFVTRIPLLAWLRPYGDEMFYALVGHEWLKGALPLR